MHCIAVNPQAVNEPGFDVFTANKRAVLYMTHTHTHTPVAFVAIGAMLVGLFHVLHELHREKSLMRRPRRSAASSGPGERRRARPSSAATSLATSRTGGAPSSLCSLRGSCGAHTLTNSLSDAMLIVGCRFDDDLIKNAAVPIETLVKVGESLGKTVLPAA